MFIKIFTNKNTEVIIQHIDNVEVHNINQLFHSDQELQVPLCPFNARDELPVFIQSFDKKINSDSAFQTVGGTPVRFVDYEKGGAWYRIAIQGFAYVCSDEGKTISKVVI